MSHFHSVEALTEHIRRKIAREDFIASLDNLWGEDVVTDPETGEETEVPKESHPWLMLDMDSIEECLGQSDDLYMEKGAAVVFAAFKFLKAHKELLNVK